jgi:hypothetical protein
MEFDLPGERRRLRDSDTECESDNYPSYHPDTECEPNANADAYSDTHTYSNAYSHTYPNTHTYSKSDSRGAGGQPLDEDERSDRR